MRGGGTPAASTRSTGDQATAVRHDSSWPTNKSLSKKFRCRGRGLWSPSLCCPSGTTALPCLVDGLDMGLGQWGVRNYASRGRAATPSGGCGIPSPAHLVFGVRHEVREALCPQGQWHRLRSRCHPTRVGSVLSSVLQLSRMPPVDARQPTRGRGATPGML